MPLSTGFDVGILLFSTDYSFEHAEHMIDFEVSRIERLKGVSEDFYVLTIDEKDYTGRIGVVHIPLGVPALRYVKHLYFLVKSLKVIRDLLLKNKGKTAILISRSNFLAGSVISILSRMYSVPSVVFYQYDWTSWKKKENIAHHLFANIAQWISLRYSSMIIVTTPSLKKRIIARGYNPRKVQIVPNHVDTSMFFSMEKEKCRKELGMNGTERNILFVGRFAPQKNLFLLVEGLTKLKDFNLYLIGEGEQEEDLRKYVKDHGVEKRVKFLGKIPRKRLPRYMNACDVFVLPSLYEGHPKALIEAMACGCAIVASDVEGNNDVIRDNIEGLFFNPESSSDLSEKVKSILEDKGLEERIRKNALESSKRYDPSPIEDREKQIFKGLKAQF